MTPPIDTSAFQIGPAAGEDDEDEGPLLNALAEGARAFIQSIHGAPPIQELLLAYGIGGILGLFLVRYASPLSGELEGEMESWVVVGDLPSVVFETEGAPTPAIALKLYCAICQAWADAILEGGDLSDCYPIRAAPTRQHAEMLLGRIAFIRENLHPVS